MLIGEQEDEVMQPCSPKKSSRKLGILLLGVWQLAVKSFVDDCVFFPSPGCNNLHYDTKDSQSIMTQYKLDEKERKYYIQKQILKCLDSVESSADITILVQQVLVPLLPLTSVFMCLTRTLHQPYLELFIGFLFLR